MPRISRLLRSGGKSAAPSAGSVGFLAIIF
jgi:hypothetical protein